MSDRSLRLSELAVKWTDGRSVPTPQPTPTHRPRPIPTRRRRTSAQQARRAGPLAWSGLILRYHAGQALKAAHHLLADLNIVRQP